MSTRKIMSVLAASAALVAALSVPALAGPDDLVSPGPSEPPPSENYYKDCDAARSAGVAPLHRDDPGYRSELDRDEDGVACESNEPKPAPIPDALSPDDSPGSGSARDDEDDRGTSDDKSDHDRSETKPAPKPETVEGSLPVTH